MESKSTSHEPEEQACGGCAKGEIVAIWHHRFHTIRREDSFQFPVLASGVVRYTHLMSDVTRTQLAVTLTSILVVGNENAFGIVASQFTQIRMRRTFDTVKTEAARTQLRALGAMLLCSSRTLRFSFVFKHLVCLLAQQDTDMHVQNGGNIDFSLTERLIRNSFKQQSVKLRLD